MFYFELSGEFDKYKVQSYTITKSELQFKKGEFPFNKTCKIRPASKETQQVLCTSCNFV